MPVTWELSAEPKTVFNGVLYLSSEVLVVCESLHLCRVPDARLAVFHPLSSARRCKSYPSVVIKLTEARGDVSTERIDDHGLQSFIEQHCVR